MISKPIAAPQLPTCRADWATRQVVTSPRQSEPTALPRLNSTLIKSTLSNALPVHQGRGRMTIHLEVPIFGSAFASAAVSAGASRIELNAQGSYPAGGLTPNIEDLSSIEELGVPIRIMIRHRGPPASGARDFMYMDAEVDAMEESILGFKASGLMKVERGDGFVFGALGEEGQHNSAILNIDQCRRLVNATRPFKAVFHRAFDELVRRDVWESALAELVRLGFDGILTSGGPGDAAGNIPQLVRILEKASDRIEIILGGGVRSGNMVELRTRLDLSPTTSGCWAHSSCLTGSETRVFDAKEASDIVAGLR